MLIRANARACFRVRRGILYPRRIVVLRRPRRHHPFPFLVPQATRRPSFADPEFVITSREPRNRNFAGYDVRYRELD